MRKSLVVAFARAATSVAMVRPGAARGDAPATCEWYAGDLHVHTVYSHDVWEGPADDNTSMDEFYTWGWSVTDEVNLSKSRGLDYLAITDHNDVRAQVDPGWTYGASQGLIMLPA